MANKAAYQKAGKIGEGTEIDVNGKRQEHARGLCKGITFCRETRVQQSFVR